MLYCNQFRPYLISLSGGEDAYHGCCDFCNPVGSISWTARLQLFRKGNLLGFVVLDIREDLCLHQ